MYKVLRSINQRNIRSGTSELQKITKLSIIGHFDDNPHKKLNVNVSILLIKELEVLIRGMAK